MVEQLLVWLILTVRRSNTKSLAMDDYVHCFCNEAFVGDHKPRYTCLGSLRTSQDHDLSYRSLIYTHDLLDLPKFSIFNTTQQTDWEEIDAMQVLVKHGDEFYAFGQPIVLPHLPELGSLGMVYCRINVPEDQLEGYRYTMAIDM